MVIHVKRAGYLPPWGWQLCRVMGGSFRVKWVAALPCNRWQLCREIRKFSYRSLVHVLGRIVDGMEGGISVKASPGPHREHALVFVSLRGEN